MSYSVKSNEQIKINLAPATTTEEILQNLSMILQIIKNTVPLCRDFGLSGSFIDKPVPVAETLMVSELYEAVEKYEPRAEIVNVTFEQDEAIGKLNLCLEVEVNVE